MELDQRFLSTTVYRRNDSIVSKDTRCDNYASPKLLRFDYTNDTSEPNTTTMEARDSLREQRYDQFIRKTDDKNSGPATQVNTTRTT